MVQAPGPGGPGAAGAAGESELPVDQTAGTTTGVFGRSTPLTLRPSKVTVGVEGMSRPVGIVPSPQAVNSAATIWLVSLVAPTALLAPDRFQPVICLPL